MRLDFSLKYSRGRVLDDLLGGKKWNGSKLYIGRTVCTNITATENNGFVFNDVDIGKVGSELYCITRF